jgi:aspartyl-tRNA(Asn)/glutamyl-tRNA(Gln) amidotransferase subunit A
VKQYTSAADIAAAVRAGQTSALAVTDAALARIARLDPQLGAFTHVGAERARSQARALDAQRAAGVALGPLAGVPFAVKNLFDIAGLATLAGSKLNATHPPASADARLIQRMEAAGAVLLGALNMGEYAYDFTGENSHYGASRNPHDLTRMSGGSSGGSGTAAAAGLCPITLGSDTNGSIRVPASLCGLFGLKPTYGRLSRRGTFPFVDSLDHLGPLARTVGDLALAYDALQYADADDPACAQRAVEPCLDALPLGAQGLRIGVLGGYFQQHATPTAQAALTRVAAALGAHQSVIWPDVERARAAAYLITAAEGGALHRERLRSQASEFDPAVRDRLLAGNFIPAAWLIQAHKLRRWFHAQVLASFQQFDVLLAPATPVSAPLLGQTTLELNGQPLPLRANMGLFTQPISFIGLPVVAVPAANTGELPIGVQVIAAPWREDHALRVAAALESMGFVAPQPGGLD